MSYGGIEVMAAVISGHFPEPSREPVAWMIGREVTTSKFWANSERECGRKVIPLYPQEDIPVRINPEEKKEALSAEEKVMEFLRNDSVPMGDFPAFRKGWLARGEWEAGNG